tara:strand:+ start:1259 stop:2185 length:927 start_codon:yes stop_codon:yes gene_type:complete
MNLKKPKFWDYKSPNLLAYLLFPLSLIIQALKYLGSRKNKKKFKIKTICIGNIYIGGTGKTSLCIKLNKILNKRNIKSCFIKKFYKNQYDEQNLLKNNGKLFVSSNRLEAIKQAESENYEIAILDDGLQDDTIQKNLNIVCFNNINWIGNGMTIPSGPLREKINNLKKYDHMFLNGNLENVEKLKEKILKINPTINIHLGKYNVLNIENFDKNEKYLIFSGIGNHQTFVSMIKKYELNIVKDIEFADHYKYKKSDVDNILNVAKKNNLKIITTEKDYIRLADFNIKQIQFIKTELQIIDEQKFINSIL